MTGNREAILGRARRLYAMANQTASEAEAMVAAEKLARLQAEHEISLAELSVEERRAANPFGTGYSADLGRARLHPVARFSAGAIGVFCDVVPWYRGARLAFFGERSDVEMAAWLANMLVDVAERDYAAWRREAGPQNGKQHGSFMRGFAVRVASRLRALKASQATMTARGRELMVVKSQQVAAAFKIHGPKLGTARRSSSVSYSGAYHAGQAAGERVGFGRPIGGAGGQARLTRS